MKKNSSLTQSMRGSNQEHPDQGQCIGTLSHPKTWPSRPLIQFGLGTSSNRSSDMLPNDDAVILTPNLASLGVSSNRSRDASPDHRELWTSTRGPSHADSSVTTCEFTNILALEWGSMCKNAITPGDATIPIPHLARSRRFFQTTKRRVLEWRRCHPDH